MTPTTAVVLLYAAGITFCGLLLVLGLAAGRRRTNRQIAALEARHTAAGCKYHPQRCDVPTALCLLDCKTSKE